MGVRAGPAQRQRITLLHYSGPPVVGGVESTIYHHARLLAAAGYQVCVLAGQGQPFHPNVAFRLLPELSSRHPEVLAVKQDLDRGEVPRSFGALSERIAGLLQPYLAETDVLIAHNVFTLHKNLCLTAALYRLLTEEAERHPHTLAWHHDLAWHDAQYADEVHPGYPWDLLRQPWPGVVHVAVSGPRRNDLARLYGIQPAEVAVVPPGVDLAGFFRWTEMTRRIVDAYRLLQADLVLLLPARVTRRKNIQLAVRVLGELRHDSRLDARLLVTGPPGAHNPANVGHLRELLELRKGLGLQDVVHFVYELGPEGHPLVPDGETMADLFWLADALFFPSREEGFGIPILEAGLSRLPIFCSSIRPLQVTGGAEAHYFSPRAEPAGVARLIASQLLSDPAFRLRRRVLDEYLWEKILQKRILRLIEDRSAGD